MTNNFKNIRILIPENIKKYRNKAKLTQNELSVQANMTESYLSKIEQGLKVPKLQMLCNIADALNIQVYDLLSP